MVFVVVLTFRSQVYALGGMFCKEVDLDPTGSDDIQIVFDEQGKVLIKVSCGIPTGAENSVDGVVFVDSLSNLYEGNNGIVYGILYGICLTLFFLSVIAFGCVTALIYAANVEFLAELRPLGVFLSLFVLNQPDIKGLSKMGSFFKKIMNEYQDFDPSAESAAIQPKTKVSKKSSKASGKGKKVRKQRNLGNAVEEEEEEEEGEDGSSDSSDAAGEA